MDEKKPEEKTVMKRKKAKTTWITATIASEIGREELLASTFKEIIFHLIFLSFLTIYIFNQINSSEYYLTNALRTAFDVEGSLSEVVSAAHLWDYLSGSLIDAFYEVDKVEESTLKGEGELSSTESLNKTDNSNKKKPRTMFILNENRVLGVPRIRQVKVTNNSCQIHGYFRRLFLTCYNKFSNIWEDRKPFGPGKPTAWKFNNSTVTKSQPYWGTLTIYSGGGYYVDLTDNKEETLKIIDDLKNNLWITHGTRVVFIDFSVYNANLNLFCICKIVFEFLPSGNVVPNYKFVPATLSPFTGTWQWILRVLLYLFGFYILFCLCEEIREIIYFKGRYFHQFWNYIDILVILLTCLLVIGTEYMHFKIVFYLEEIHNFSHLYGNLETAEQIYSVVRIGGATVLFFVYLRTFKYLNFNRRMAQLNNTIKNCSKDIAGFSVMFFVAYFAYAELGYLVFGSQVNDFKDFGEAMFTLLRTILGDFDYNEIRAANWFVAPIYFLSYIILVFFILLNMFLAIINDTYADVKTDIALAPKEMEMTEYITLGFYKFLRKLGFKIKTEAVKEQQLKTNISRIRDALVKCNFNDREIQMYFTRYDIDPLKTVTKAEVENFFEKFAQEDLERRAEHDVPVTFKDFEKQDEKLRELENSLLSLGQRVHQLLTTIETLQNRQREQK